MSDPDGKNVVSGGHNGRIEVWDLARRIRTEDIAAGKNPLSSVRFRRDGKVLASADYCGRITLWNAATFAKVAESGAFRRRTLCYVLQP